MQKILGGEYSLFNCLGGGGKLCLSWGGGGHCTHL